MPKTDLLATLDAYDAWLARHCDAIPAALDRKRRRMAADPFALFRGTAFRFAAQFAARLSPLRETRHVPSCGDAHLENFGTWRDAEGRLVWGVNDLDEAACLPFAADLVRLATSALLGRGGKGPGARDVATIILRGYRQHLRQPRAFVLDEEHAALRAFVVPDVTSRAAFWAAHRRIAVGAVPPAWQAALAAALPEDAGEIRYGPREAGLGSLGRPRFVATAAWRGGLIVREAKARVPSAWLQADVAGAGPTDWLALVTCPGRAPDPCFRLLPTMVIRRLAPDGRKLEAPNGDASGLLTVLESMGGEVGNLHASDGSAGATLAALDALPADWLRNAARTMVEAVEADQATLAKAMRHR